MDDDAIALLGLLFFGIYVGIFVLAVLALLAVPVGTGYLARRRAQQALMARARRAEAEMLTVGEAVVLEFA